MRINIDFSREMNGFQNVNFLAPHTNKCVNWIGKKRHIVSHKITKLRILMGSTKGKVLFCQNDIIQVDKRDNNEEAYIKYFEWFMLKRFELMFIRDSICWLFWICFVILIIN